MTIYELSKWRRHSFEASEETVAYYESWKDANLEKRTLEFSNSNYEYAIYTCRVIPSSEVVK